ncbi:(4-{4-[2-(gamma-L-glutamylamino)ethyl]phenoxymethyl}furan-2-yl)methanamine synthase [Methanothermococcus okinawensis]|nr:(4-{4-[2-(gamma-L-glutamylamino)ethyl]phenoxymethyl}furan-2-yl)methanamine synthase [Methanothermococcus okinawensis]
MILGIDIGGANTKITELKEGDYKIHHIYFPMWKTNEKLTELLQTYNNKDIKKVAVVMTAELADAYETKKEGVNDILDSVENAFPNKEIYVFDVDGNFLTTDEAKKEYLKVSASNWTATANFVCNSINNNCILVDMGSTTTDIIPIKDGNIMANKTDLDRLMNNELVYVGTLRTPLSFLGNTILYKEKETNISSEYFAITGDIHIILDKISSEQYTCDTPDGAPPDKKSSMVRLSRMLCGDLEQINKHDIISIANQFYGKLLNLITYNVNKVSKKYNLNNIVITGLGEEVLKDALKDYNYNIVSIKEKYGKDVSLATPSFAVAKLLSNRNKK